MAYVDKLEGNTKKVPFLQDAFRERGKPALATKNRRPDLLDVILTLHWKLPDPRGKQATLPIPMTIQTTRENIHPLHAAVQAAYNTGDLPGWASLYENEALLVSTPDGALLKGLAAIRPELARFSALNGKVQAETLYALEAGDLMLLRGRFTLNHQAEGAAQTTVFETVEVARRGQDGGWRFAIDHPAGAA